MSVTRTEKKKVNCEGQIERGRIRSVREMYERILEWDYSWREWNIVWTIIWAKNPYCNLVVEKWKSMRSRVWVMMRNRWTNCKSVGHCGRHNRLKGDGKYSWLKQSKKVRWTMRREPDKVRNVCDILGQGRWNLNEGSEKIITREWSECNYGLVLLRSRALSNWEWRKVELLCIGSLVEWPFDYLWEGEVGPFER